MKLTGGTILNSHFEWEKKDLFLRDGKIVPESAEQSSDDVWDITGLTVLPGLIDLHIHGYKGIDLLSTGNKELDIFCHVLAENGTTSFLCTLSADSLENTLQSMRTISAYQKKPSGGAEILGFYLEAPYLSKEKKGAIPEQFIRKATKQELEAFCNATENQIKIMTIAPEIEENMQCIPELKARNIIPAIGHSNATAAQTDQSLKKGLSHATHLFNAMRGISHREPGIPGAVFDSNITAELICDGFHVDEKIIRMSYRLLGKERLILVSDNGPLSGCADGRYVINGIPSIVRDRTCRMENGTLKGNYLSLFECVKKAISFGIPLKDAFYCASYAPAKRIGMQKSKGSIDNGKDADLLLVDNTLTLQHVIKNGKRLK